MLPPLLNSVSHTMNHLRHGWAHSQLYHVIPTLLTTDGMDGLDASVGNGNMQNMLNGHIMMYTFRQTAYTWILSQSQILKEILSTTQHVGLDDIVYYSVLSVTVMLFVKDMTYKKSTDRVLQKNTVSRETARMIHAIMLMITMVLFQDVDIATG